MKTAHIAGALTALTLSLGTATAHAASFTTEIPLCISPNAPSVGCQTTAPIDLRNVTAASVKIQARNYSPTAPADATISIQFISPTDGVTCLGVTCTTITIPNMLPSGAACCGPWFTTIKFTIPPSQRINGARMRLAITGGNLDFNGAMHPLGQFYY